mmetsp:Transcript_7464/g.6391  ORF Transcript_7464/g.6391 Transcript_7464/m.6391 type:complete len:84 (+) Transcript_7464:260-511(+)
MGDRSCATNDLYLRTIHRDPGDSERPPKAVDTIRASGEKEEPRAAARDHQLLIHPVAGIAIHSRAASADYSTVGSHTGDIQRT